MKKEPLEKHQEQLLDYAFNRVLKSQTYQRRNLVVLSTASSGKLGARKFGTTVDWIQDKAEIAQKLVDLLGRENVRSGRSVQNAEVLYKKHRISATLPEAWNQLVSEPEDLIVDLLVKKTKELCGEETNKSEVERFLSAHLQNIKITSPPAVVEPIPVPEPKPPDHRKGRKHKAFTVTKPTAFTFNGQRYDNSWKEMLVKLCEIHAAHEDRFKNKY